MTPPETKQAAAVQSDLKKIKDTLRTFIAWMDSELGRHNTTALLDMLADQPPIPEPMEVEVWVHGPSGRVRTKEELLPGQIPADYGWTLRRATIHPEQ